MQVSTHACVAAAGPSGTDRQPALRRRRDCAQIITGLEQEWLDASSATFAREAELLNVWARRVSVSSVGRTEAKAGSRTGAQSWGDR